MLYNLLSLGSGRVSGAAHVINGLSGRKPFGFMGGGKEKEIVRPSG